MSSVKRTSRDIRTANRYEVLRQIIAKSPTSRQELAAATGLSLATVATLVGELLDLRMITEVGFEDSAGGRPRGLVAVNASGGALIGVDIAETYVHVELFDLALNVLARAEEDVRAGESLPEQMVGHVAAAVGSVVAQAGIEGARVLGVGVSVPGQVDRATGISEYAPNWDWHDVPLLDLLTEHIAYPLYLDNPLRAVAVAELWFGAARGRGDAVIVNLGTGVGAGLVLGGGLHRGVSNSAGEWGHTTIVLDGQAVPLRQPRMRGDVCGRSRDHAEPPGAEPAQHAAPSRGPDGHHRGARAGGGPAGPGGGQGGA